MRATARLLPVVAALALGGGCTVLFAVGSGDEGALCAEDAPRCKDGFVCVDVGDDGERCLSAGFLKDGDPCLDDGQCESGLCGDGYEALCDGAAVEPQRVLDCAIRARTGDATKRCRRDCTVELCPTGFHCFAESATRAFCQESTCASDSDCVDGAVTGLCVDEGVVGGKSGLCRTTCNPIACLDNDNGTPCTCAEGLACMTPLEGEDVSGRAVCDIPGVLAEGEACGVVDVGAAFATCDAGLTCAALPGANTLVCQRWCQAVGAPSCNVGASCSVIEDVGVCR